MTRIAIRDFLWAFDFVLFYQSLTQGNLVRRRRIINSENIRAGADVLLRVIVAIDAPPHVKSVLSIGKRHIANRPVARGATDTFVNMNTVVKVNEIGHCIDSGPLQ